jgi:DNA-binding beta-propeller fold protein YncE
VYVSNGREGTVTPIATATNTPGLPIPVGRGPGLIAITQDGKTAYVTTNESTVVPIDTATGTPGAPIRVGVNQPDLHDQPDGIAITPDGKTVYVANIGSGTVTPIDTATNAPDGKTAYVGVWGEPGTVVPIATATNTPGQPIQVGDGPYAIAITP